ncbi:MAG: ATP-grasp ribosomal peptide maturase [Pseudonocardiaceae bacterium]
MTERTVLILTQRFDPTADYVVNELCRRGVPVIRMDPGDFPGSLMLSARLDKGWSGTLGDGNRVVDLTMVRSIYYRRPTVFRFNSAMSAEPIRRWATNEARHGFGGVISTLSGWLNHPANIGRAGYKPLQLDIATRSGLTVPPTLVTNDPVAMRDFVAEVGSVVVKPLGSGIVDDDQIRVVYTTPVPEADVGHPAVALTAHLFQARICKQYEVRLTVVDSRLFAARIDATSEIAQVDWRADPSSLRYSVIEVPAKIRAGMLTLMRRLGLRFGAADFIVTSDNQWLFLEVNPNGQWAFIEDATGQPITAAIADALQEES